MFSLIIAILIVVLLVKCIGLVGAKTEEVKQRTKNKTLKIKMELMGNRRLLIFYADAKNAWYFMEGK